MSMLCGGDEMIRCFICRRDVPRNEAFHYNLLIVCERCKERLVGRVERKEKEERKIKND